MTNPAITGAILAGGPGTGMPGVLKPLLRMDGETLIERQVRRMRELCAEIIVVTNAPKPLFAVLDADVRIITDYFPDSGPLGGMHAALRLAKHPWVWIAGSDMPFVSPEAASRLRLGRTEPCRAAIPLLDGQPVVLHGLYDARCAETAGRLLAGGERGLEAFLGRLRWQGVPADAWLDEAGMRHFAYKIDKQADYERAQALLAQERTSPKEETAR
ncbi:molybdenum cofactor guanylyltransferase [Cohnella nanjingensis]|uniref:Molybdenum cofactor guanylyltransferase n=1 Tax=Cohnella nanjingensis TaxID=1387779 RepID=A0A7X0RQB6_9BACL|nr:molybdenum cofactor guanylyltransferase [Cohnella nanjingensis]MBB6671757.1 molybdenum cofactor guanylyltransferase [Cohnella nanjingensis]